jgi:hypothetical protein
MLGEARIPLDALESSHVCVLTRIRGKFSGGGESVRVVVGDDRRWWLELDNHTDQWINTTAYCFWKGGFHANGSDRSISPLFEAREGHGVRTWNGDAATFLAGVNGHLRGGGEHARIVQSFDGSKPSDLRVGSAAGYLKAWAYSFFAGTPGSPAKFFQEGKEFSLDHVGSLFSPTLWMAKTEEAMCYFTKLQGQFDGGGDWARIVPALDSNLVERWRLEARGGVDAEVFAAARCYLRDQR